MITKINFNLILINLGYCECSNSRWRVVQCFLFLLANSSVQRCRRPYWKLDAKPPSLAFLQAMWAP